MASARFAVSRGKRSGTVAADRLGESGDVAVVRAFVVVAAAATAASAELHLDLTTCECVTPRPTEWVS